MCKQALPCNLSFKCFTFRWQVEGTLSVSSYASPHSGPQGPFLNQVSFQSSQHIQIGGNKSCADIQSERYEDKEGSAGHHINVLLPYPLQLMPQVYYQLELCISTKSRSGVTMTEKSHGYDDTVKCVKEVKLFGRSSPPVRSEEEREVLEKPLRWFEMKREGLQPVGSQLPIIYYIPWYACLMWLWTIVIFWSLSWMPFFNEQLQLSKRVYN